MTAATAGCPPHDWLQLTGGAIGQGLPLATGAAVACPDRPVLSLEADGSAMYTIQSLWTQARESLDVTTVIVNNRSYAILNIELARTGAGAGGPKARDLLDLSRPDLDFVRLAGGHGRAGRRRAHRRRGRRRARARRSPSPARTSSTRSSNASACRRTLDRGSRSRRHWAPGTAERSYTNGADRFRRQ